MVSSARRRTASQAVGQLLDELRYLSEEGVLLLAEAWSEEDPDARRRAWQRAKSAIERAGLADILDGARREVADWLLAAPADYQGITGSMLGREGDHVYIRRHAAPAVLDAVAALLAAGDLHSADQEVLARPWRIVHDQAAPSARASPADVPQGN